MAERKAAPMARGLPSFITSGLAVCFVVLWVMQE